MTAFFSKDLTLSAAYSNDFYAHHQEIAEKGETPCHSYLVHKTIALLESVPGLRVLVAITELIIAKALMCICCYCYKEEPLADPIDAEAQPAPLPLSDLPPENKQPALPQNVLMDVALEEEIPGPIEPLRRQWVISSLEICYPFGIGSFLDSNDIMHLTSITRSFCASVYRQPILKQTRELAEKRAFMKVGLPDGIRCIYEAMRDRGSIGVVDTRGTYFYPNVNEMRSSFAVCQNGIGQRWIVLLVGGKGDSFVEIPALQPTLYVANRQAMRIPAQSIVSAIFIREYGLIRGVEGWLLDNVRNEISELEKSFISFKDLYTHPEIKDAIVSIIEGTHPSLKCISHREWEKRRYWFATIKTKYDVPEGYSLIIRGNGPAMENWEKNFDMMDLGVKDWCCQITLCQDTEFKLYLMTPWGEFIPEEGPNRLVKLPVHEPITPPQFPSIEHFSL